MSILKHVSGHNYSKESMSKLIDYATEAYKTDNGKYIHTRGCSVKSILKDMYAVKRAHHKEGGKQGEHFVISISPDEPRVSDNDYIEMGRRMADFYINFQSVVTLHKDSKVRHLHVVINGTSFVDGKKFSQSPSSLNSFKNSCNKILTDYGLDPIRCKPSEITDSNHYSFDDDLDFLEILDDIPDADCNTESFKLSDIEVDASKDIHFDPDEYICKTTETGMKIAYPNPIKTETNLNEREVNTMNNDYIDPNMYDFNNYMPAPQTVPPAPMINPAVYGYSVPQYAPLPPMTNPAVYGYTVPQAMPPGPMNTPDLYKQNAPQAMPPTPTTNPAVYEQTAPQPFPHAAQAAASAYPNLTLDNSKNVTVFVRNINEAINIVQASNTMEPIPLDEKINNTNMGMAALAKISKAGYKSNVIVNNSTNTIVKFTDDKHEEETEVIDVDFEVE